MGPEGYMRLLSSSLSIRGETSMSLRKGWTFCSLPLVSVARIRLVHSLHLVPALTYGSSRTHFPGSERCRKNVYM